MKVLDSLELELDDWGYIKVNENNQTSEDNVFAAGDICRSKINSCLGSKIRKRCSRGDM